MPDPVQSAAWAAPASPAPGVVFQPRVDLPPLRNPWAAKGVPQTEKQLSRLIQDNATQAVRERWPASGDPGTQTFRLGAPAARQILTAGALPIAIFLLLTYSFTYENFNNHAFFVVHAPPWPHGSKALLVDPLIAFVFCVPVWILVGIVAYGYRNYRGSTLNTVLIFSDHGIEQRDKYFHMRLRWANLVKVDHVITRIATTQVQSRTGKDLSAKDVRALGVQGWGSSAQLRRIPKARRPVVSATTFDPATGMKYFGLPLHLYDRKWTDGPMALWIQHYRPDLAWHFEDEAVTAKPVKI